MFYRVRIPLVAALVVIAATVVVSMRLKGQLETQVTETVRQRVERAQRELVRVHTLQGVDLASLAASFARDDEFLQIFGKATDKEKQEAAGVACDGHNGRLEKLGRKAGIVGLVDAKGNLLARNLSYNWRYNEDLTKDFPSLTLVLAGTANKDVWEIDGQMYRVGAAPVRNRDGQILGAVFVGYHQSSKDAAEDADGTGTEVGYFFESRGKGTPAMKLQSSSLKRGEGQSSESSEEKQLAEQLFALSSGDPSKGLAAPAYQRHELSQLFRVRLNNQEFVAAVAPIPGNSEKTTTKSGFVVLANLSSATASLIQIGVMLGLLGFLGVLAAVIAATATARRFLVPLDRIEAGATEVINGNRDYVFESPSPDFEGLANDLNVMLARLLGRPEPGEEGEEEAEGGGERWQGDALFVDEAPAATPGASPAAQALAAEPAEAYYPRLWKEYLAARQQTGESLDGLAEESFIAKVKQNEAALAKKYGARMVRFAVVVKGGQATLKPVPIT